MLINRKLLGLCLVVISLPSMAQMMTVTEATLLQSEILRAELNQRLTNAGGKGKNTATNEIESSSPASTVKEDAPEELPKYIGVYGIGQHLKGEFIIQGSLINLEPSVNNVISGWRLERLSKTNAVLSKIVNNRVEKRVTVHRSAASSAYISAPIEASEDKRIPSVQ